MKAILLAAGLGSRLRPLTDVTPKCLLPVAGKPLMALWFEKLFKAGIDGVLVNTHHLSQQVVEFVRRSPFCERISLVHEEHLLGTLGTLRANRDFFEGQDGLLIHADNYCDATLDHLVLGHDARSPECVLTAMTFSTNEPSECGIMQTDDRGVVTDYFEKHPNPPGNLANGAVYALSAQLLREDDLRGVDFARDLIPRYLGRIATVHVDGIFVDIGSHARYRRLRALLDRNN